MEEPSALCPAVPLHELLACAAKVVGMLSHHAPGDDPFARLFTVQGDIEAFAGSVESPLEAGLAEAMRFMSAEMMRRQWFYTTHPHAQMVNAFAEVLRFAPYRFQKKR
jgi:hypothetical protein